MAPTVLITGGSQGIGRETANLFAQHGYNLVLTARRVDLLEEVAQGFRAANHPVFAMPADTRDPEQVKALVEKAIEQFGAIDVLVNNAGIFCTGPVDHFSLEDWHTIIDTNLWGYIHTIHAVVPHMIARGKGTIVNLSSIGGKSSSAYLVPYVTSKYGVTGLTESLHAELSPKGITVCGIYPNIIKSDFMERALIRGVDQEDEEARRKQLEQVLSVPVVEKPGDVAKAIWDAVKNQKPEVVVGSAKVSLGFSSILPGVMQWLTHKTFQNRDKTKSA
ncbi:SDR family NAD(P)-dependent oxidoreductase [Leptolyngbya ohadii]|uniref:SDR family NAD(P)-dependent oxidoreductase n=1 Tax=Leptolyngbya ohadii TaxID=1962290 RepID=UPI000B59D4F1|nr:SDR family NAD(P)-dependent oxidoreductase [Leptolyngbya ohadii]